MRLLVSFGPRPNRSKSSSAVVSDTGTSVMALLGTHSVLRYHVKTQSRLLFFSCSTLEPNTEVFSKVSQSLALVNSVSTLLNKGGIACSRPTTSQDFCASAKQTQTCTATPFQPCTSRHERKRGSAVTAADKSFKAARTSSEMLTGICSASKAHPMPRKLNNSGQWPRILDPKNIIHYNPNRTPKTPSTARSVAAAPAR